MTSLIGEQRLTPRRPTSATRAHGQWSTASSPGSEPVPELRRPASGSVHGRIVRSRHRCRSMATRLTQRATEQLVGSEALVSGRMTQVDARVVRLVGTTRSDPSVRRTATDRASGSTSVTTPRRPLREADPRARQADVRAPSAHSPLAQYFRPGQPRSAPTTRRGRCRRRRPSLRRSGDCWRPILWICSSTNQRHGRHRASSYGVVERAAAPGQPVG